MRRARSGKMALLSGTTIDRLDCSPNPPAYIVRLARRWPCGRQTCAAWRCRWFQRNPSGAISIEVCVSAHRPVQRSSLNMRFRFTLGLSVSSLFDRSKEALRHERAIDSLRERRGAPLAEVRSLFAQEFSRLELGAKVRSYLAVLAASKVRAMLRRKDTQSRKTTMT